VVWVHPRIVLGWVGLGRVQFSCTCDGLDWVDLERRNSANRCVISPNLVAFRTDYVKVVGDTLILSAAEM